MFCEKLGQLKGARVPIEIAWEIADFLSLSTEVDACYESPSFFCWDEPWCLRLFPNGETEHASEGHIGLYLVRERYGPPVSVTYRLFLKKTGGKKEVLDEVKRTFDKVLVSDGPKAMCASELIAHTSEFLPSGVFTVICSLKSVEGPDTQLPWTMFQKEYSPELPRGKFYRDVGQLKGARRPIEIAWEIADFISLTTRMNICYVSPTFFCCDAYWYLQLCPNSEKKHFTEGYMDVYLRRADSGPPVSMTSSLFLKKLRYKQEIWTEEKVTFDEEGFFWGVEKAIRRPELIVQTWNLPSGVLTFICSLEGAEIQTVRGTESAEISPQTTLSGDLPSKVLRDFENLLLSEEGTDVIVNVQGQEFKAHRTILMPRSPVFASMLSHDMKQNTGVICVDYRDPEAFPDFLRFLYCRSLDNITSQNACSLFRAADKYDVQDLKAECLAFIKSHLDVDNFCEVLSLALQYREADLLQQSTDFFADNMQKIVETVKWQVFLRKNTTEGKELMMKAAEKRSSQ